MLARRRQASLDVDLLTVCLNQMTSILHEFRTLEVIHTSLQHDHAPNEGNAARPTAWDKLIETMKDTFYPNFPNSVDLSFQMLPMALDNERSNPIRCQIDTTRFISTHENHNDDPPQRGRTRRRVAKLS